MMKDRVAKKMRLGSGSSTSSRTELDKYFTEDCKEGNPKFDILNWWKVNSTRLLILSRMARDVLAISISTVASESAFSIGRHVLDDFRTLLTPFMVEALVCIQDWLRRATPINIQENAQKLAALKEELIKVFKEKATIEINKKEQSKNAANTQPSKSTKLPKPSTSKASKSTKSLASKPKST